MLYLDEPVGPIGGLEIYRDHENRNLFYYVSSRPRLAVNEGVPEFVFLKYRRDITDNPDFDADQDSLGGGFLSFTVDLSVDQRQLDNVKRELRKFAEDGGAIQLAPIQFRKGTVRLSIAEDKPEGDQPPTPAEEQRGFRLYERIYGASKPSLFGDNRATFSLLVDREMATLLEAGLRSGISPLGVIYDLEYLGLSPAFNVKVTAEYKRVYTHLETEFGARGQIYAVSLAAEIAAAFQKLRDDGSIKVEVLQFTDDADLKKQSDAAFEWFKTQLLNDFFKTALQPPSFMTRAPGSGGLLGQLQSLLGSLAAPQAQASPTPQRGAPTPQPPTAAPPPTGQNSNVANAGSVNQGAAGTATGGGGGGGGAGGSGMSPFQLAFSLKMYRQEELKTRTFEYSMQAAVAREAAPQGLFSTFVDGLNLDRSIIEVDMDDEFFDRLIARVSMGEDLEAAKISSVAVNLEYPANRPAGTPADHTDGFLFRPGQMDPHTFTTFLNQAKDREYRYKMDVTFNPASEWIGRDSQVSTGWITTTATELALSPLDQLELLDVEVSLGDMDTGEVVQVEVDMIYDDPAHSFHVEKTFLLKPDAGPVHWRLRLGDEATREFQYRFRYFLKSGNLRYQTDFEKTENPTVIVNEPFSGERRIRLLPLLPPDKLLEAVVDISYVEETTGYRRSFQETIDTTNVQQRKSIVIPTLDDDMGKLSFESTVVHIDGSSFESGKVVMDSSVALISDGLGATHRINVKLPVQNLGPLIALKVNFVGPGENPDSESCLFTPSQVADQSIALVQPDDAASFVYKFQVMGYDSRGNPIPGQAGESSDKTFIVPVLAG